MLFHRRRFDSPAGGADHAVDFARRLGRHGALLDHVIAHFFRIALERIAEAPRRGPDHAVVVAGLLDEVFLAERKRPLLALPLRYLSANPALLPPFGNTAPPLHLVHL